MDTLAGDEYSIYIPIIRVNNIISTLQFVKVHAYQNGMILTAVLVFFATFIVIMAATGGFMYYKRKKKYDGAIWNVSSRNPEYIDAVCLIIDFDTSYLNFVFRGRSMLLMTGKLKENISKCLKNLAKDHLV